MSVVTVLSAAAVAGGLSLWATEAAGGAGYRTATASMASMAQVLDVPGTAQPVHQATAEFQVGGTVAAVDVSVGQRVSVGETLATLETTTLQQAVTAAQSRLSADEATLSEAESAASTTTTTTTTPSAGPGGSGSLQSDQQAVLADQRTADGDASTAATALAAAQSSCGTGTGSAGTSPGGGAQNGSGSAGSGPGRGAAGGGPVGSSGVSTTTTTTTTPTSTPTSPTEEASACSAALDQALAAQQRVAGDQRALAGAEAALAQLLDTSAAGGAGSGVTGAAKSSTSGGSSGAPATPAQLASDQAAIDSDEASLVEAQQALGDAQLVSPLAGTVASVSLASGESVAAGATTEGVTVIGAGSYEVTGSLTTSQYADVKVGDPATVTVDGEPGRFTGTVAQAGPVEVSSSGDSYPLVIGLTGDPPSLTDGASAQADVVLHSAHDVLSVPTSAVHTVASGRSYVFVERDGQESRRPVTVGVVGAVHTQILSGVSPGTTVVLAALDAPVPSSSASLGGLAGLAGGGFVHFQPIGGAPGAGSFVQKAGA